MKKYLEFNIDNKCCGVFDTADNNRYEFDYDPNLYFLPTLELRDGVVVHTMPGLTYQEQETKFNSDKEKEDLEKIKLDNLIVIKNRAKAKIEELSWKLERAKEQDLLEGTSTKTQEILLLRQQIRQASNEHEAKLMAIKTREEMENFDLKNF